MGTIKDKLTYLNTTKLELYSAINRKNGGLTRTTPFREYASKIDEIKPVEEYLSVDKMFYDDGEGDRIFSFLDGIKKVPDELDFTGFTSLQSAFNSIYGLEESPILLNTSEVTSLMSCFNGCMYLKNIISFDTSKVTTFRQCFKECYELETIELLDYSSAIMLTDMFKSCEKLTNIAGFKDLGKSYTATTNNNSAYKLDLSASSVITKESVLNIFNNLYDLNLTYDVANGGTLYTQSIILGSDNLTRLALTDEELAIATNKGWTIS